MISYLAHDLFGPSENQVRQVALKSAITLREGSFSARSTRLARRACRLLMREEAFKWRRAGLHIR